MLRFLPALVTFATLAPAVAQAAPCTTATPQCTEWVRLGDRGRSLVYRSHPLDARNESITRVLVMIHGAGRNADGYFESAMAAAFLGQVLDNALVIAPRMASNDGAGCRDALGPDEISWHCNTWRSGGPSITHPTVTSFDFLDEILRKVARKQLFPNLQVIVVAGHSAGGQVTNRYAMSNQVHDKLGIPVRYVVSNPSSFAWPGDERPTPAAWTLTANPPGYIPPVRDGAPAFVSLGSGRGCATFNQWPFGLLNRTGYSATQGDDQLKRQLAARPVTYPSPANWTSCRCMASTTRAPPWRRGPRAWRAARPSGSTSTRNSAQSTRWWWCRPAGTTHAACSRRRWRCRSSSPSRSDAPQCSRARRPAGLAGRRRAESRYGSANATYVPPLGAPFLPPPQAITMNCLPFTM